MGYGYQGNRHLGGQTVPVRGDRPVQQTGDRLVDASPPGSANGDPSSGDGIWQRQGDWSVNLHSDRGSQCTSADYQHFLTRNTLVCSMSAGGHCGDNAGCEGFFGQLKRERAAHQSYRTRDEARADLFDGFITHQCFVESPGKI
ncbi:MAG TPA: hypothetical protein DHU88_08655 [Pseudomonas sp.]|nr:hypothetical protein [Stutzerimonas balearica]HCW95798.1 hypothetical protein [Pseudomonas sp.]